MVFPSFDLPVVLDKQNLLLYTVLKYHLKYGFIKTYFLAEMYGRVLVLEYLLDNLSEPHLLLAKYLVITTSRGFVPSSSRSRHVRPVNRMILVGIRWYFFSNGEYLGTQVPRYSYLFSLNCGSTPGSGVIPLLRYDGTYPLIW